MKRIVLGSMFAALFAGCWVADALAVTPADDPRLDSAGSRICRESSLLERAQAGLRDIRRDAARAAQQTGRGDEAEQRRAFLASELSQRAVGAQEQIVAESRRSLISAQAEYRQLAGQDFDNSFCEGSRLRVSYMQRVQEAKEQELDAHKAVRDRALADGEAYRQGIIACEDWKILQQPPEAVERWRPGYRAEAEQRFESFSSDYRRKNGKPFDTGACR